MKVIGNVEDINLIKLIHKGKDIKFQCFKQPMPYMSSINLERNKVVEIIFDDLCEVDEMITMLEQFKKECRAYLGEWGKIE